MTVVLVVADAVLAVTLMVGLSAVVVCFFRANWCVAGVKRTVSHIRHFSTNCC